MRSVLGGLERGTLTVLSDEAQVSFLRVHNFDSDIRLLREQVR